MTRKDYVVIADAIANSRKLLRDNMTAEQFLNTVLIPEIATALQSDNPNFDKPRFIKHIGA